MALLLVMQLAQSWGHPEAAVRRRKGSTPLQNACRQNVDRETHGRGKKRGVWTLQCSVLVNWKGRERDLPHLAATKCATLEMTKKKWSGLNTAAVRGCNVSSGRLIPVILLGKPMNITIIQVDAPNTRLNKMKAFMQVSKKRMITHQNKTCW